MPTIVEVPFAHSSAPRLAIESFTLAQLRQRAPAAHFERPERLSFHLLVLYTAGQGRHVVDFQSHPVKAGTLVLLQPQQVQRYDMRPALAGRLLLIGPGFLPEFPLDIHQGCCWSLPAPLAMGLRRLMEQTARESASFDNDPCTVRLLQHAVLSWLYELRRHVLRTGSGGGAAETLVLQFRRLVNEQFREQRAVAAYARVLKAHERTLARACLAATGMGPKALIDQRVALEARRLLAHTADSTAEIGNALGFSETTNFLKFFRRVTAETASAFRTRVR